MVSEVNEYERILEGEELQRTVYKGYDLRNQTWNAGSQWPDSPTARIVGHANMISKSAMAFRRNKQTNKHLLCLYCPVTTIYCMCGEQLTYFSS